MGWDVIRAEGGPRRASIPGAGVAVHEGVDFLVRNGGLPASVIRDHVAAVSVGIYKGVPVLDLDYAEDSDCDTDMNVVMTGSGGIIEVQGTAEGAPFRRAELDALLDLAEAGIRALTDQQKQAINED